MTQVQVKNGNLDFAIKKYKQKLARNGVPSEAKKHDAYDKPGVRRRKPKKEAMKNARKNERKQHKNNRD